VTAAVALGASRARVPDRMSVVAVTTATAVSRNQDHGHPHARGMSMTEAVTEVLVRMPQTRALVLEDYSGLTSKLGVVR
jgi:hypothetical protein